MDKRITFAILEHLKVKNKFNAVTMSEQQFCTVDDVLSAAAYLVEEGVLTESAEGEYSLALTKSKLQKETYRLGFRVQQFSHYQLYKIGLHLYAKDFDFLEKLSRNFYVEYSEYKDWKGLIPTYMLILRYGNLGLLYDDNSCIYSLIRPSDVWLMKYIRKNDIHLLSEDDK